MREQVDEQLQFVEQFPELHFGTAPGEFVQVGVSRSLGQVTSIQVARR